MRTNRRLKQSFQRLDFVMRSLSPSPALSLAIKSKPSKGAKTRLKLLCVNHWIWGIPRSSVPPELWLLPFRLSTTVSESLRLSKFSSVRKEVLSNKLNKIIIALSQFRAFQLSILRTSWKTTRNGFGKYWAIRCPKRESWHFSMILQRIQWKSPGRNYFEMLNTYYTVWYIGARAQKTGLSYSSATALGQSSSRRQVTSRLFIPPP